VAHGEIFTVVTDSTYLPGGIFPDAAWSGSSGGFNVVTVSTAVPTRVPSPSAVPPVNRYASNGAMVDTMHAPDPFINVSAGKRRR